MNIEKKGLIILKLIWEKRVPKPSKNQN